MTQVQRSMVRGSTASTKNNLVFLTKEF